MITTMMADETDTHKVVYNHGLGEQKYRKWDHTILYRIYLKYIKLW